MNRLAQLVGTLILLAILIATTVTLAWGDDTPCNNANKPPMDSVEGKGDTWV